MRSNTSDIVHRSIRNRLRGYPPFDPDTELFPEITATVQRSQSSHPLQMHLYGMGSQLVPDPSGFHIRAIPDSNSIQDVTTDWNALALGQCPFPGASAWNALTVLHCSEMHGGDLVMRNHPVLMAPTIPQIELRETETGLDQPTIPPLPSTISLGELGESTSESLSQVGGPSSSQECYALWKRIRAEAIVVTGLNKFVPQELYRPFTLADKERYLERISLSAPIIFTTREPLEWGISLDDVLGGRTHHLVDKDGPVLRDCGPSISIRINWPGYPPFKRQISSRNWRRAKGPITKEKLAQNLAKTVGRFIDNMSNKPLEAGADIGWKVGPQHIGVQDLILVSLHHVSKGSWQPQYRLHRDVT